MEISNEKHNVNTLYDLPFDSQLLEILGAIQLDSNTAVFAGLHLLEIYYNKIHEEELSTKYYIEPNSIDLYLFGPKQTIIEKINQIFDKLRGIKTMGVMRIYNCDYLSKKTYVKIKWTGAKYSRPIKIYCMGCKNVTELMDFFEPAN